MKSIEVTTMMISTDLSEIKSHIINIKINGLNQNNDMIYSYTLPKHIYNNLVDTEPEFQSYQKFLEIKRKNESEGRGYISDQTYLRKTVEDVLVSSILSTIDRYSNLIHDRIHKLELIKTKKIFVQFIGNDLHKRCEWTGGYMGKEVLTKFQYFTGYEIEECKKSTGGSIWLSGNERPVEKNYYTLILHATGSLAKNSTNFQEGTYLHPLYMGADRTKFLNSYTILDWTEEREDFFRKLQEQFTKLNTSLHEYLSDLDNDKLELIMSEKTMMSLLP